MGDGSSRVAVVTGVSRRQGIGFAIARRLLADGLDLVIHSWSAHDADKPWAAGPRELERLIEELGGLGARLDHVEADFADPGAPRRVIDHAVQRFGGVDVLIVNHARSARGCLSEISSTDLDLAWAVDARASVLLTKAYAEHHDDSR
jgi:3-oxoacyl-[acyl-carrier protein] reductase